MKIIDNFLEQIEFDKLQTFMMGPDIPWHYNDGVTYGVRGPDGKLTFPDPSEKDKFQFVHLFYMDVPNSENFQDIFPLFKLINPISVTRIKANLLTKTVKTVVHGFHVDMVDMLDEKMKLWTTSIFYVNTNNGYTEFEDGTKVESVANRMVTFPTNLKHRSASCTDEKRRIVINFNYFERLGSIVSA